VGNFFNGLISEIVNFTLLSGIHFCISIDILEFSSGMQLCYMEIIHPVEIVLTC
jgi:hypothetical protein